MTAFGDTSPEAVEMMREALRELYGVEGGLLEQYVSYWRRMLVLDFGPSLSAFPTPVSVLIGRALPWTIGLLFTCTLVAWLLGNLLGGLSGYYRNSRTLDLLGVVAMALHPVPYYIIAFILLLIFGYVWPVLPISGGAGQNIAPGFTLDLHRQRAAALDPPGAVDRARRDRRLVPRHARPRLQHRDGGLRHLCRARRRAPRRILPLYVMRNALVPQITGLAMSLGAIFNGAIIVEQVFSYPGLGRLLIGAVYSADYSLVLGVTAISIIAVAASVFLIDILYPLFDPRMQLA